MSTSLGTGWFLEAWRLHEGVLPWFRARVCFMSTSLGTGWFLEAWRLHEGVLPWFWARGRCRVHAPPGTARFRNAWRLQEGVQFHFRTKVSFRQATHKQTNHRRDAALRRRHGSRQIFFLLCSFVSIANESAATAFAPPGQTETSLVPSPVINLGDRTVNSNSSRRQLTMASDKYISDRDS